MNGSTIVVRGDKEVNQPTSLTTENHTNSQGGRSMISAWTSRTYQYAYKQWTTRLLDCIDCMVTMLTLLTEAIQTNSCHFASKQSPVNWLWGNSTISSLSLECYANDLLPMSCVWQESDQPVSGIREDERAMHGGQHFQHLDHTQCIAAHHSNNRTNWGVSIASIALRTSRPRRILRRINTKGK